MEPTPETSEMPDFSQLLQGDALVYDVAARAAKAKAAFDDLMARIEAHHDSLEGVHAQARADLMWVRNLMALAKLKL